MIVSPTAICTASGKLIDVVNLQEGDIVIEDIAHALAMQNRFSGHTPVPYSTAQHSVLVSKEIDKRHAIHALMHEAADAYLGSVSTALRVALGDLEGLEQRTARVIANKFGYRNQTPDGVLEANLKVTTREIRDVLSFGKDLGLSLEEGEKPIVPVAWDKAKKMFLDRFKELTK